MSSDPHLFQAPRNPEPPKDMYYQIPTTPPVAERPKPIFPWESTAPKPTRVFPEDLPPPPAPSETTPSVTTDEDEDPTETGSPSTPTASVANPTFPRTNAWDEVPEIDRYIAALPQNRRGKIQVLLNNPSATINPSNNEPILSPTTEEGPPPARRQSMKLTDFPTEVERPSLPVTPAPVRRPSFWGAERDVHGELPGAEGVPHQSEWDPVAKLQDLARRQSEMLASGQGGSGSTRTIPDRDLPGSASVPMSDGRDESGVTEEKLLPSRADPDMPSSFQTTDYSRGQSHGTEEQRGRTAEAASAEVAPTES